MRERILNEIRRLSELNGGKPLGRRVFERETGIRESSWAGIYWTKWSDAVGEAGFVPNAKQERLDTDQVLRALCEIVVRNGRFPTSNEWGLARRSDSTLPMYKTLQNHLGNKESMIRRVREWAAAHPEYGELSGLAETQRRPEQASTVESKEGHVYLLRSGAHYKIGRSDQLERRVKEVRVALPEALELVHAIRTDDPAGIEAYWHRRFASARANGEWFRLSPPDVAAFRRRKYQ